MGAFKGFLNIDEAFDLEQERTGNWGVAGGEGGEGEGGGGGREHGWLPGQKSREK